MKHASWLGLVLLLGALLVLFSPPPISFANSEFVPGELLVRYKANVARNLNARANATELGTGDATLDALNRALGVQKIAPLFQAERNTPMPRALARIFKIEIADDQDVLAAAAQYAQDPNVEFAEPNYLARAIVTPNDPEFASQWGLTKIAAPTAWDTTTGSASVTIALIDSGMDKTHADLSSQLWTNPGEVAGNGIDDDANGYIDDVSGWNFIAANNDPSDDNGHGTLVAGIAGAATNNAVGVAGVCWQCKLMPVKVMSAGGVANYSDVAAGVIYAAQKGARVINISLGGSADSQTLHAAIQSAANDYNAVVVAGAGNDNASANFYPAAYDEVLAVAGTDESDVRVATSNYGAWVDVSAPGQNIRTTASGGGYATSSGTSLAAPFAAGLAGLLRSQNESWSQALTRNQMVNTTDNVDAANPSLVGQLGSGRINAASALTTNGTPLVRFVNYGASGETNAGIKTGVAVPFTVTLRNDWKDAASVQATLSTSDGAVTISDANANYGAIASGETKANDSDTFQISVTSGLYGHVIPFTLNMNVDGSNSQINFNATTESAVQNISGLITTDTIWSSNKIYHITGNVRGEPGVTLTIQPGTHIEFASPDYVFAIRGTLRAIGSSDQRIEILGGKIKFEDSSSDWDANTGSGSIIERAILFDVLIESASPKIANNLIQLGGISLSGTSDALITGNTIENEPPPGSFAGVVIWNGDGNPVISNNRIFNKSGGIYCFSGNSKPMISHNLVSGMAGGYYQGIGILCNGAAGIVNNTVIGNEIGVSDPPNGGLLHNNNLLANTLYDLKNFPSVNKQVPSNWWGTTNTAEIDQHIYDFSDDFNAGVVDYQPILTNPEPLAPAYLHTTSTSPNSPIGLQPVTFDLTFSAPMNQNINPVVTFGATQPYTTFSVTDNAQWLNDKTWRATYDITSLVPRGSYTMSVSSAVGLDGMEIPTDTRFSFVVDYAGGITDQTPPTKPVITDDGVGTTSLTQLHAKWSSTDAQSPITQYQYALGTSPGATDVVNWKTPNPTTATEVTKTGLNLTTGQKYYFSVKARNEGGLWSDVGVSDGIVVDPNFVALGKPKLKSPVNKALVTKAKVKLNWNDVVGATSYHVIVRQGSKNGNTKADSTVTASQYTTPRLKKGQTYYWQVQACNAYGCFAWTKWWSFKVQ